MDQQSPQFLKALRDFRRARRRATLERIFATLTDRSDMLFDFDDVRERVHAEGTIEHGLQDIPLDAIIGSVGRYQDFTRSFLPRRDNAQTRWASVKTVFEGDAFPPISVYEIGDVYFVIDGNHRVSIAREAGHTHIPAYVTEIKSDIPLSPDMQPDDLICHEKYADFLAETHLHDTHPDSDFTVTAPGQYRKLLRQIDWCRRMISERTNDDDVSLKDAASRWYTEAYLPTVKLIRERGILRYFPDRTETDLYVWIANHRDELRESLGWDVPSEAVAQEIIERWSPAPKQKIARAKNRILDILTPESLEAGPEAGAWRQEHLQTEHLFYEVLVPMTDKETGWRTLNQAQVVARKEGGRLHALHIGDEVSEAFEARLSTCCPDVEIDFAVEPGNVLQKIVRFGRWADIIVYTIAHPPYEQPLSRLNSDFNTLIRQTPRPVLVVPGEPAPLDRALLAYDGSPKAREALFVAAYLAARWHIDLYVLTVIDDLNQQSNLLKDAQNYLSSRQVQATYINEQGAVVNAIQSAASTHNCDFLIMGGYGFTPLLEVVLGSTVDTILRLRQWPVLICR